MDWAKTRFRHSWNDMPSRGPCHFLWGNTSPRLCHMIQHCCQSQYPILLAMEKGISPRSGQSQCLISLAIIVGPGVGHVTQAESIRFFEIGEGDLTLR